MTMAYARPDLSRSTVARSVYPQRQDIREHAFDEWARSQLGHVKHRLLSSGDSTLRHVVALARTQQTAMLALDNDELRLRLPILACGVWRQEGPDLMASMAGSLALLREAARRTVGLVPYDTQLMGAAGLAGGKLVEMQTGEGKTLTAGIAAALIGSAGVPVHVATVNDYLAQRDADELRPLFEFFGLSVGTVITGMDLAARRASYACDVTYCTGKELVFDYLKDRVAVGAESNQARFKLHGLLGGATPQLLLRGLHFAIVDEADSIFIDEARTPLILSENAGPPADSLLYEEALAMARAMREREHFVVRQAHRELRLTPAGRQFVTERCVALGREWTVRRAREHWVAQALRALHMFHCDQHYIVRDDKVQIVDEQTGRVLPGRIWEEGLHQMIESKEGCKFSDQARTVARITYQRFFRRFLRLSGMTGTAREVRGELWRVYGLETVSIPTHRPSQRRYERPRCVATEQEKWELVALRASEVIRAGRPVLIGTRSVEASEALSLVLDRRGLSHRVLNARQDAGEAELVSSAGEPGMLTVATNMAGRGTDIKLPAAVKELGGLHVILTEFHEAKRVDRQLFGRAARQGDPGSVQAIVSFHDLLFRQYAPHMLVLVERFGDWRFSRPVVEFVRRQAQRGAERIHARTRAAATKQDKHIETMLSFSGKS